MQGYTKLLGKNYWVHLVEIGADGTYVVGQGYMELLGKIFQFLGRDQPLSRNDWCGAVSNYPWVGRCVLTVILVYPKSTKLLSVAIHPQILPQVKFMSSLVTLMIILLKLQDSLRLMSDPVVSIFFPTLRSYGGSQQQQSLIGLLFQPLGAWVDVKLQLSSYLFFCYGYCI